jgi:hypothetical protein
MLPACQTGRSALRSLTLLLPLPDGRGRTPQQAVLPDLGFIGSESFPLSRQGEGARG